MTAALVVGFAGMLGALVRFMVDVAFERVRGRRRPDRPTTLRFPAGTLLVNAAGSLLIGFVWAAMQARVLSPGEYSLLAAGLAGGMTTFSTFSVAAVSLWLGGMRTSAVVHVVANLACGLAAAALGLLLGGG